MSFGFYILEYYLIIMKVLLAFDSFKDTLSAQCVSDVTKNVLENNIKDIDITIRTLSDGGEGFLQSLSNSLDLEPVSVTVNGPLGNKIESFYSIHKQSDQEITGIIEMASASGLEFVPMDQRNPLNTTAVGVGQLIKHAIMVK